MNPIKAYVPCDNCSYYQVALYEGYTVTHNVFDADVCIDDPIKFLKRFRHIDEVKCVLWGDTMYDAWHYFGELRQYENFVVPSYWNYMMFHQMDLTPKAIVKRHIRPIFPNVKRDKLFITLGESRFFDRKNLTLVDSITRLFNVRGKTIIVGNMGNPDYSTFSLTEEKKYELYARSKFFLALSKSEGFGLPPIEAMAVGTVPIYLNAHGYKENLTGIPIDPIEEDTFCADDDNCFRIWELSRCELRYEIQHALHMGKEEYEDLSEKAKIKSREYYAPMEPFDISEAVKLREEERDRETL
jgi:glycosyltransferase involved in cell wall biosynthesis